MFYLVNSCKANVKVLVYWNAFNPLLVQNNTVGFIGQFLIVAYTLPGYRT